MDANQTTWKPPLIIGAAVLFWGWLAQFLIPALLIAMVLLGSRFVKRPWPFDFADFRRVTILCDIFMLIVILVINTNKPIGLRGVLFIQWLPLVTAPLIIAQYYSEKRKIHLWSLFLTFGKTADKKLKLEPLVDLTYPYIILCVLSASAANTHQWYFYTGVLILAAWGLFGARSSRYSIILWAGLLVSGAIVGHWGAIGLHQFQRVLENKMLNWYLNQNSGDVDPYRSRTAIGDIDELKLSGKILLRVRISKETQVPLLLRETSYNLYQFSIWFAKQADFKRVSPESNQNTWRLYPQAPSNSRRMMISEKMKRGQGLLKLPNGAWQVTNLPALSMQTNPYGAVRVEDCPELVNYVVHHHPSIRRDQPPEQRDLIIPDVEAKVIHQTSRQLKLAQTPPSQKIALLKRYFHTHFKYTLKLETSSDGGSPVAAFLTRTRAGHCEYFATSAVLLLRAAGVPARYATGYLVNEYSRLENCYVVRTRHAHAWALAHINGQWRNVDVTPPAWPTMEADNAPQWQPISDFFAWLWYKISQWRAREDKSRSNAWLWLLAPMILYLARRLIFKKRVKPGNARQSAQTRKEQRPGIDSCFYQIQERLQAQGFTRHTGETLIDWIKRIETIASDSKPDIQSLNAILRLHYRLRFDPKGISKTDQSLLQSKVDSWLKANAVV